MRRPFDSANLRAMSIQADLLADVPLFALLDESERSALAERLTEVSVASGSTLFREGDPGDSLYVVKSGAVEISVRTTTGETLVLEKAAPGDFFGELSLLDGGPRTATARAVEGAEVLVLDRDALDEFLRVKPAASLDLLAATARRLRENTRLLHGSAARNVNEEMQVESSAIMRVVDAVAAAAGSLAFLVVHLVIFTVWIGLNVGPLAHPPIGGFDRFPFGFLTLCVSLEAIVLSCLLLLSQNRQGERDRVRNDVEYDVNLKAELEIAHLHEKVDAMNVEVLRRLEALSRNPRA